MTIVRFTTQGGQLLCRAKVADTVASRLRGLLGKRELAEGEGLWLTPCRSVHTFFLSFPIDVLDLTQVCTVEKVEMNLAPFG